MNLLKKINKGLILTIIVLLILGIYLFVVESKRNAAKPEIEEVVKEYIAIVNKYSVVPEDMQKIQTPTSNEEFGKINEEMDKKVDEYLNKYEAELKEKMIDNKEVIEMQKDAMKDFLDNANNYFQEVVTKYNREIVKIRKYAFDEDQVTVTFETSTEIESKYLDEGNEKVRKENHTSKDETITLQLVNGKWKVVYADLIYYNNLAKEPYTMVMGY